MISVAPNISTDFTTLEPEFYLQNGKLHIKSRLEQLRAQLKSEFENREIDSVDPIHWGEWVHVYNYFYANPTARYLSPSMKFNNISVNNNYYFSNGCPYVEIGLIGKGGAGEVRAFMNIEKEIIVKKTSTCGKIIDEIPLESDPAFKRLALLFKNEIQANRDLGLYKDFFEEKFTYGDGSSEGHAFYLTLTALDGFDLFKLIEAVYELAGATASQKFRFLLPYIRGQMEALLEAHNAGWIHDDVKPHNFIALSGGKTKMIDFGAAQKVKDVHEGTTIFSEGEIRGTDLFFAPEKFTSFNPKRLRSFLEKPQEAFEAFPHFTRILDTNSLVEKAKDLRSKRKNDEIHEIPANSATDIYSLAASMIFFIEVYSQGLFEDPEDPLTPQDIKIKSSLSKLFFSMADENPAERPTLIDSLKQFDQIMDQIMIEDDFYNELVQMKENISAFANTSSHTRNLEETRTKMIASKMLLQVQTKIHEMKTLIDSPCTTSEEDIGRLSTEIAQSLSDELTKGGLDSENLPLPSKNLRNAVQERLLKILFKFKPGTLSLKQ
jgi:serine/threonine protein kinase